MYHVYFAKSLKNGKIYVGSTSKDPKTRVIKHNQGSNTWSKNNGPFKLIYYDTFVCKEDSLKREQFFKTGIGKKIKKAIVEVMDL